MKYILFISLIFSVLNAGKLTAKSLSLSILNSKSHEFVYSANTDKKLSELLWEANNIKMLGVGFDYQTNKNDFLSLNYKFNIIDGNDMMNDYDWLKDNTNQWSHWSHHPNTKLKNLTILDISFNHNYYQKII